MGEDFAIELLLASVIAKGHVLIVDVPGVGKTTLAKSMAKILGLDFNRIQFTNDILPADILGGSIYNSAEGKFSFSPGPYSRISCWQMKSTGAYSQPIGFPASHGRRLRRSRRCELSAVPLFTVIATQNPIDFDSTNPLPEAQLDRFLTSIKLGYPDIDDKLHLLNDYGDSVRHDPAAVLTKESVTVLREACEEVYLHEDLARYIIEISRASREDPQIKLGISPRGSMHLAMACKAFALVKGRHQVIAEDVQRLIPPVWDHRILPRHGRDNDSIHAHELLQTILENIAVPR